MKAPNALLTLAAVASLLPTANAHAQAANPSYLREMPSVERVRAEIKGADAMDTAARQMGAFWQLQKIIETLSGLRWTRGQLTPDEGRLVGQYRLGYSTAEQSYAHIKSSPSHPDKAKWFKMHSFYEVDEDFREELFKLFFSPAFREQYFSVKGETRAFVDQRKAARAQALKEEQQQQAQAQREFERTYKQPEWKRKVARCIASGRSEAQCFSEQIGGEVDGYLSSRLGLNLRRPAGLWMSGVHAAPGGLSVAFGLEGAHITCKGVPASADYAVRQEGGQLQIRLLEDPAGPDVWQGQRVALTVRPDGRLSGAGLLKVSGKVVVGHSRQTGWEEQRITPSQAPTASNVRRDVAGNLLGEVQVTRDVPIYAPKTEQCALGVMTPKPGVTGQAAIGAMIESATSGAPVKAPPPGLRMTGNYTGQGGFEIEFHPDSAVLGCREAVVARDYTVTANAGRVLVNIQHGGAPLALELRPDGALSGAGQVQVSGRVMVGSNRRVDENTRLVTHDPVFQPVSDTCGVGVLTPAQGGSAGAGPTAGTGVAPSPARPQDSPTPARPNNVSAANTPAATAASAVLTVTDAFAVPPGTPSPFAGKGITLWRESAENIIRKGGVRPPPGTSALKAWLNACASGQPICQQAAVAVGPLTVASARFGPGRQAQLPAVPPGTYYVFAVTRHNNQTFLWDLRVDLKPGANAATIDQRNVTPVN
ncbi:MAG TPA: hypothetical protein VK421_17375 [Pyrinomonadaceae bacterium]|nr:hypothetical protein [Pyrinomonadaceae bacterium]